MGRRPVVRRLRQVRVREERLRVAVADWEPGALDLDHDAVALLEDVVRGVEVDRVAGEVLPWERLSPATVSLLGKGLGRRLNGPLAFKASVVLAQLGDRLAYPIFASAASSREYPKGPYAILSLGVLGDRRATPRLLTLLKDPNDRDMALQALGRLRDPASVAPLLRLDNGNHEVLETLAAIGDRSIVPTLVARAKALEPPLATNCAAPIGRLGGPEARAYLLDLLEHGPKDILPYLALAFGEMRDSITVGELRRIAKLPDPERANRAFEALQTIAYRSKQPKPFRTNRPWWPNTGRG